MSVDDVLGLLLALGGRGLVAAAQQLRPELRTTGMPAIRATIERQLAQGRATEREVVVFGDDLHVRKAVCPHGACLRAPGHDGACER